MSMLKKLILKPNTYSLHRRKCHGRCGLDMEFITLKSNSLNQIIPDTDVVWHSKNEDIAVVNVTVDPDNIPGFVSRVEHFHSKDNPTAACCVLDLKTGKEIIPCGCYSKIEAAGVGKNNERTLERLIVQVTEAGLEGKTTKTGVIDINQKPIIAIKHDKICSVHQYKLGVPHRIPANYFVVQNAVGSNQTQQVSLFDYTGRQVIPTKSAEEFRKAACTFSILLTEGKMT